MCGAPGLSQHMFPGGPTVEDLWAACSPPALISSARANLLTPPVWRLLVGRWPRLVWRRNTAKSLNSSAVTKLQLLKGLRYPPSLSERHPQPVYPSVRLSALAGCGRRQGTLAAPLVSDPPLGDSRLLHVPVVFSCSLCCEFNMPDC